MVNKPSFDSDDLPFKESPLAEENRKLQRYICELEHDIFFLYVFLTSNDSCDDALEFLESHAETPMPFRSRY